MKAVSPYVRRVAAESWLRLLFWHSANAPALARAVRPVILYFAWRCSSFIRDGTLANARHLLGADSTPAERTRLGKRVAIRFYEAVLDFGRNRRLSTEQLRARVESVDGVDHYERARALRRGAIIVTAHLGPFETAVAHLRAREPRVHIVFQRDRFAMFESLRSAQRHRLGVLEAPVDDGLATWLRLREALSADEVVVLQGDRTMPGQKGAVVRFLDGHMRLPEGPVKLAQATGAPILPIFATSSDRGGGRVRISIKEPFLVGHEPEAISVEEAFERLADVIASQIHRHPDQWIMLEKAWCEDQPAAERH